MPRSMKMAVSEAAVTLYVNLESPDGLEPLIMAHKICAGFLERVSSAAALWQAPTIKAERAGSIVAVRIEVRRALHGGAPTNDIMKALEEAAQVVM